MFLISVLEKLCSTVSDDGRQLAGVCDLYLGSVFGNLSDDGCHPAGVCGQDVYLRSRVR